MIPQRVRVRCEPNETQIIKWTAEGMVKGFCLVFHDVWHTLVVGDMLVSC